MPYGFLSLLPPLCAIGLALWTRQIYLSLCMGIWLGFVILAGGNPFLGSLAMLDGLVAVFAEPANVQTIMFTLLIGAMIGLVQYSGGVQGFVEALLRRLGQDRQTDGRGRRMKLQLVSLFTGVVLFIESNISILTVGTLYRPVFDKLSISREKLAYITDSSGAPSCVLIPFNAWGAFITGLLLAQGIEQPFGLLLQTIMVNFYPLVALLILCVVIISGRDIGPMRRAEARMSRIIEDSTDTLMPGADLTQLPRKTQVPPRAYNMLVPMSVMVIMMPVFLMMTGWSDAQGKWLAALQAGSGAQAVLYAVGFGCVVAVCLYKLTGVAGVRELSDVSLKSIAGMIPFAILILFAFTLGQLCRDLGTGQYVAQVLSGFVNPAFIPVMVFLTACFISFSTGTSWGTFAIMLVITVPLAQSLGVPMALAVAATISGGIFGDHCSPISDTSIISSLATSCDHMQHVRTQLPYAMIAGGVSGGLFLITGLLA